MPLWTHRYVSLPVVCGVLGGKYMFSEAPVSAFQWILWPTILLVRAITGIGFEWDRTYGWVSHTAQVTVGASCAGTTFFFLAFLTLYLSLLHQWHTPQQHIAWVGMSLLMAYVLTILTTAIRISVAIPFFSIAFETAWLTNDRVHRLIGTLIYVVALVSTYLMLEWRFERRKAVNTCSAQSRQATHAPPPSGLIPLMWYTAVVMVIPLFLALYRDVWSPTLFEHSLTVMGVCVTVYGSLRGIQQCRIIPKSLRHEPHPRHS